MKRAASSATEGASAAQPAPAWAARVPWIVTAVALATVAVGIAIRASGTLLGVGRLPPFVMNPGFRVDLPWLAIAAAVIALAAAAAARLLDERVGAAPFMLAAFAIALAVGLAVNSVRGGPGDLDAIFDLGPHGSFEAKNEYLPALPALAYGPRFLLDHFAELVPSLPANAGAHPPGLLLVSHALGIGSAGSLAALVIGVGALTTPLTYLLACALGRSPAAARAAALLCAACPATVLFGVTSADFLFATVGLVAAVLLVRFPPLGALALAVAVLFSWALLAIGAWGALVTWQRRGLRAAIALAAGCALAIVAVDGLLAAWVGYDAIGVLRATEQYYRDSLAAVRPYAFWLFGSGAAWLLMLGAPIGWWLVSAAARRDAAAVSVVSIVVIAAVLGFTKAETERIWLPFVPLACVAAVTTPPRRIGLVVAALGAQALALQVLFFTVW